MMYYICHHGIKGQRWGIRHKRDESNGRQKGAKQSEPKKKKSLTDKQKKYIKRGAIVAGVAIAIIGGAYLYKTGRLNGLIDKGQKVTNSLFKKNILSGDTPSIFKNLSKPENIKDSLKKANPFKNSIKGKNTCVPSALAGFMRMHGKDVVVKSTGGKAQNMAGVIEECFKNPKVYEGSAVEFSKSPKHAAKMLIKRFGNNAEGMCSFEWNSSKEDAVGHAIYWKTNENRVSFYDFKTGSDNILHYWNNMKANGSLQMAQMKFEDLIEDAVKKYVQ